MNAQQPEGFDRDVNLAPARPHRAFSFNGVPMPFAGGAHMDGPRLLTYSALARPSPPHRPAASVSFAPSPEIHLFSPSHSDPSGYTPRPPIGSAPSSTPFPQFSSFPPWAAMHPSDPSTSTGSLTSRTQDDLDLYNAYLELTRLSTDLGATPYRCAYCDKSFGRSDVRAKHMMTMHPDQAPPGAGVGGSANGDDRGRRGSTGISGPGDDEEDEDDGEDAPERPRKVQRQSSSQQPMNTFAQPAIPIANAPNPDTSPLQTTRMSLDMPTALQNQTQGKMQNGTGNGIDQSTFAHAQSWIKPEALLPNLSPTGQLSLQGNLLDASSAINNSLGNIYDGHSGSAGLMMGSAGNMGVNVSSSTPFSLTSNHSAASGNANSGFLDPSMLHVGSSLAAGHDPMISGNDLFDPLSNSWPVLNNIFGWGMSSDMDMDLGLQLPLFNQHVGATSSTEHLSAAWLMSFTPQMGSPAADAPEAKEEQERQRDPFGRNHDNPWPSYFKPVMPDRPLTLGGVKARPRPPNSSTSSDPPSVGPNSRNAMLSLVYLSHQTHWMMPDIQDFPDSDTLSHWVDLYFENFHPSLPVLHRATWKTTDVPAVLMLATLGIGASYADEDFKPITVATSELVRRMVTWLRASDQRSKFDINVTLAYLLQAIAGMACGSRELMLHTEITRASLVTSLRRLHLLRAGRSALDELLSENTHATAEQKWKAWLEDEGRRRFGWSIFLLDQQMLSLLDCPAVTSISEARVSLPSDERLWDAPDARAWEKVLQEIRSEGGQLEVPFLPLLHSVLDGGTDVSRVSPFARLEAIRRKKSKFTFRLSYDAQQLQTAIVNPTLDEPANLEGYPAFLSGKPYRALHDLALALTPTSVPSYLQICSPALYHHSRIALSRTGLLQHAKAASGKFEPDISKPKALMWLQKWARDKKEVRRVLWHAGVLNALLAEFPRGHYTEPFWAFDCALVFWVIIKYGQDSIHSSELKSALFAANWFDVDPPNMWIQHGGQIFLPSLGSSTSLKMKDTLEFFIRQLGAMPWGLAAFQKQVLTLLLESEVGKDAVQA